LLSVFGVIFSGGVLGGGRVLVPEPGLQLEQGHRLLGVVELAGDGRAGPVAGDIAADIGGRDPGPDAQRRDDGPVDVGLADRVRAEENSGLGAQYRRIVKKRGKKKAIVAISRVICETAWILICDPGARYTELGPDYHVPRAPARATQDRIREIERLNPGKKVILADADAA
jgi:hypothetical protein